MGARGGRLDGRHHRHPVPDRERFAAGIRWIIKEPREFVNDYIFNFPDTSFAWAFVLALLAAALAARKRIAWWILVLYMVAAIGWNVGDIATGGESWMEEIGETHRPRLPRRGDRFPGSGPQAVLGEGPARRLVQSRRGARRRHGRRHSAGLGPAGTFPGHAGTRRPVRLRGEPGQRLRGRRLRTVRWSPARVRQRGPRPVRRTGADGRGDRAVPIAARRERAHRRGRIRDPRPARAVRQERLAGLFRHPPRQGGRVRAQRPGGDHLSRRGRCLFGQRRPRRRPEGMAAGHSMRGWRCAKRTAGRPG